MKMPSLRPKIFIFLIVFGALVFNIQANTLNNNNIISGDSLFKKKDYQASLRFYKKAFDEDAAFSQQMLARMAMMEEAADNYVMTLFYLNTMYSYYPDSRVMQKMEDMGNQYHLLGYSYTDLEYAITIYKEYYYYIIFSLSALGFPFIIYLYVRKRNKKRLGIRPLIFLCILGAAFYLNNYDITPAMGIIHYDCPAMEGPSPGSSMVEQIEAGHRVRIVKQEGIWYEIVWKTKNVFIRDVYLMPVGN